MSVLPLVAIRAAQANERRAIAEKAARGMAANYTYVECGVFFETLHVVIESIAKDRGLALAEVVQREVAERAKINKWLPPFMRFSTESDVIIRKLAKPGEDLTALLEQMTEAKIPGTYWEAVQRHDTLLTLCKALQELPIDNDSFVYPAVRVYMNDWNLCASYADKLLDKSADGLDFDGQH